MRLTQRIVRSRAFQLAVGNMSAAYLQLVRKTNRLIVDPNDLYIQVAPHLPIIVAMWHGQHYLVPFLKRDIPEHKTKVLVSRHRDGEINAIVAERLGIGTIRGSGDHSGRFDLKGGVGAFKSMVDALKDGYNVALTADIPKVARVAGNGIVKLASISGRPMYAIAMSTSRRFEIDNWDRSTVNLPFGRMVIVADGPHYVPANASDEEIERARVLIETRLNAATERAHGLADGTITSPTAGPEKLR
jgi:lysophospholipid acyltransferase (LPLAT)-like uncharacterized protein